MMLDTTQNEVLKYDDTSETHSHHLIPKLDNYYKSHSCHPDTFPRNTELRVGSLQLSVPQHSAQEALVLGGHKPLSPHKALSVMLPEIYHNSSYQRAQMLCLALNVDGLLTSP